MNKVCSYIENTLGANVQLFSTAIKLQLPNMLLELYTCHKVSIEGQRYMMLMTDSQNTTPSQLKKHLALVSNACGLISFVVLPKVDAYFRAQLIKQKVPFVVTDNQIYLPFLGIDLRDWYLSKINKNENSESLSIAAQVVALYLLNTKNNVLRQADIPPEIDYSKMSVSRAIDELKSLELITTEKWGNENIIHITKSIGSFWNTLKKITPSPVKHRYSVESSLIAYDEFKMSGLTALAAYSDITAPVIKTIAMDNKTWRIQKAEGIKPVQHGDLNIEVWAYDPALYAENNTVNKFALYLSLMHSRDERVEMSLEQLFEGDKNWYTA